MAANNTTIHLTVEVYDRESGRWVWQRVAPEAVRDPRNRPQPQDPRWQRYWEQGWFPTDDNYDLFQRLAQVRGTGGYNIAAPRGLPLNLSDGLRRSNVDLIKSLGWELTQEELGIWVALQMLRQHHDALDEIYRDEGDFSLGDHQHSYLFLSELLFQQDQHGRQMRREWGGHTAFLQLLWHLEYMTKDPRTGEPLKHPTANDIRIVFGFVSARR